MIISHIKRITNYKPDCVYVTLVASYLHKKGFSHGVCRLKNLI